MYHRAGRKRVAIEYGRLWLLLGLLVLAGLIIVGRLFQLQFDEGAFLNGQYTIVGEVTSGMDVVDQITKGDGRNGAFVNAKQDVMEAVRVTQ